MDRERFLLALVQELSDNLRDVAGEDDAVGYLDLACCAVSDQLERTYLERLGVERLDPGQLPLILSDFQEGIGNGRPLVDQEGDQIVLSRLGCCAVGGADAQPTFCDIVTGVVGHLTAQACGYARVVTHAPERCDDGGVRCRMVIDLVPRTDPDGSAEFFRREWAHLA